MTASLTCYRRYVSPVVLTLWMIGALFIWFLGRSWKWSPGELIIIGTVWFLVLAAIVREHLRNLFGPVFWYELFRVGRRFNTFLYRFIYVLVICAVLTLMYVLWRESLFHHSYSLSDRVPPGKLAEFAAEFFNIFSVIQYGMISLVTPAYVAGTITDEKERKTIDYLFTTDLANREIVFGKLAARVATVFLYILAGLPVIAFLQLFGGIDPDLALASTTASLITAIGLSAVAIALSAAMRRSREAILASYGLLVVYLVSTIILSVVMISWSRWGWTTLHLFGKTFNLREVTDWLAAGNAVWVVPVSTRGGSSIDLAVIESMLGRYAVFWGVVSVFAIGWAVTSLRRVALQQSYGPVVSKKVVLRAARKRPTIGNSPWVWKEVFAANRQSGCFVGLFRAVVIGGVAITPLLAIYFELINPSYPYRRFAERWQQFVEIMNAWVRICTGILTFLICLTAALRGAGAVAGEKDRDTWVCLCVSPVTVTEFLYAKWMGALLGQRFLLWVLGCVWMTGLLIGAVYWFMIPVTIVFLTVFTSAFALAGIWCSISARTALVANIRAFFLAVFMAGGFWLVLLFCCVFPLAFGRGSGGRDTSNFFMVPLGATPPVMTGFLPMGSFDQRSDLGPGPFHPEVVEIGPCAPPIGLGVWVLINIGFLNAVRFRLTQEMNRGEVTPESPNPARSRITDSKPTPHTPPPDYSPEDQRMHNDDSD